VWRAGALSKRVLGHPAALELPSRSGDHDQRPAGSRCTDAIGAAIDRAKRGAIVLALAVLGIGAIIIFVSPTFWPVLIANSQMAIVGDVFGPAVAAVTLGLYARSQLARRTGRNSAFDHAGNVAIAVSQCFPFRLRRSITTGRETSMESKMRLRLRPVPRLRHPVQIPAAHARHRALETPPRLPPRGQVQVRSTFRSPGMGLLVGFQGAI
jgi:hypothetical protein